MLKIREKNKRYADISCTNIDSFDFTVETDNPNEGQLLELQIAAEYGITVFKKVFNLVEGEQYFVVKIKSGELKLPPGIYDYRLILYDETGEPQTHKSGRLKIKWGA